MRLLPGWVRNTSTLKNGGYAAARVGSLPASALARQPQSQIQLEPLDAMPRAITLFLGATTWQTDDNLQSEIERLKAENERLKSDRGRTVSLKVSAKGGVSVYGLGRFPVTLYKEQWTTLLSMTDEIRAFIKEHEAELKSKPEA